MLAAQVHLLGLTLGAGLPPLRLGIFDAWRPVSVQAFMVNHAVEQECARQGINPDDSEQLERLGKALAKAFGRELQLNVEVDEEVIGGVHVTVNGEVIDGTVLTKLVNARLQLS